MLAAKVLKNQNIDVTGISFRSYFFNTSKAKKSAKQIGIKLITHDFSQKHLKIVQKPKHGYGKALNPCIDCHALMLKETKKIAREKKFNIIATGEVLGQRPLSQTKPSLAKVEKEAGLEKKVLRPLSAKLLPKTVYEIPSPYVGNSYHVGNTDLCSPEIIVDRDKLLDISGRSRKRQMALAKKFGIKEYSTPAGGCLLTEVEFCKKLEQLLNNQKKYHSSDFELIKIGKHYWGKGTHIVIGRNKEENDLIEKLALKKDIVIKRKDTLGPTALIRSERKLTKDEKEDMIQRCQKIIWHRSKEKAGNKNWDKLGYTINHAS